MRVFGHYARYYDLLYKDKDYAGEANYVDTVLQRCRPGITSILELGCGTGMHALLLAAKGYQLHGIDASPEMLRAATARLTKSGQSNGDQVAFSIGDIRSFRLDRQFDAVVALFHVVSYQTSDADLEAVFETVTHHLRPGGLFLFDCWYGPAVLTLRPSVRIKRFADSVIEVTRIAEPVLYPNENCVDVRYSIFIRDKESSGVEEVHETHRMRYFFTPELDRLFAINGLKRRYAEEWMSGRAPGCDTWGVCFVGQL
jgi:SAM-dependent methyltransferase